MKLSLYELTTDFTKYMEAETDEEIASALADITAGQIEIKAGSYCQFIASLDGFAKQCEEESKRIANVAKIAKNKADRIKDHMKRCLLDSNITKLQAGTFTVSIQNNPPVLNVLDSEKTPASYRIIIPEAWQANNTKIKEDIKAGIDVPGYELTVGKSLRIK